MKRVQFQNWVEVEFVSVVNLSAQPMLLNDPCYSTFNLFLSSEIILLNADWKTTGGVAVEKTKRTSTFLFYNMMLRII